MAVASALLNVLALRWIGQRRVEANMRLLQEDGKVAGVSIAALQSMETIKASGLESGFFERWSGHYAKAGNARQQMELSNQMLGVLPGLLASSTNLLILVLGGWYVIQGDLSIGLLIAFQMLAMSFLRPVGNLVRLGQTLQDLQGDLMRLDDVLAHDRDPALQPVPRDAPTDAAPPGPPRLERSPGMRDLTFGYGRIAPPLIEDFDLDLRPGSASPSWVAAARASRPWRSWSAACTSPGRGRSSSTGSAATRSRARS